MKSSFTILIILLAIGCNQVTKQDTIPDSSSPVEMKEPTLFNEGEITTLNGISFSKNGDTLFTSRQLDRLFDDRRSYAGIFESRLENGKWTTPKQVLFDPAIDAYHPVLSMNNELLFFNSRSHLDSANKSVPHDIWVCQKTPNGWSTPEPVEGVNSSAYDSYPSIARNNNLYFNSDREGGKGGMDFYVSYFVDGQYQTPINLEALNTSVEENDLVVDPDERFIIFNRYVNSSKEIDLFISFRKENEWTTPRKLDNINSIDEWELTPTLSPDGKYFFYELNNDIMQIELAYLIYPEELEGVGKRSRL